MGKHDDTRVKDATILATDGQGHFIARHEDGWIGTGVTYEYAEVHHPEMLQDPDTEFVRASWPREGGRSGPAMVASNAYRAGWERVFGKAEVGEA